jgi:ankyrin repeat protein
VKNNYPNNSPQPVSSHYTAFSTARHSLLSFADKPIALAAQLGRTGLIQAANTGQIEVVALLLENGANANAADTARIPHTSSHKGTQERDEGRALTTHSWGFQSASHVFMIS